jgi:hypothetical protein
LLLAVLPVMVSCPPCTKTPPPLLTVLLPLIVLFLINRTCPGSVLSAYRESGVAAVMGQAGGEGA